MGIVRYLFTRARGTLLVASAANATNAAASAGLVAWIHHAVSPGASALVSPGTGAAFLAMLAVIFASGLVGQVSLIRMTARSAFDIRLWIVRRVLALPLARLEHIGGDRVYACLTQDVTSVSNAWIALPVIGFHAAMLLGGAGYLIWLSWELAIVLLATMVLGLLIYQRLAGRGRALMARFREQQDAQYAHFDVLVRGAKELRSSRRRAEQLLRDDLEPDTAALRQLQIDAFSAWAVGNNWGNVLTLAAIGVLLSASGLLGSDRAVEALGFVLAVLFLRAHLGGMLNSLPALAQGDVALRKIEALGLAGELEASAAGHASRAEQREDTAEWADADPRAEMAKGGWADPKSVDPNLADPNLADRKTAWRRPRWRELSLDGVEYRYGTAPAGFRLGPLDVAIRRGEILFVTGGNGSGKSTFVKLLVGLYRPDAGHIRIDGEPVDPESDAYRQRFCVLFSDYHLFSHLTTRREPSTPREARELLAQLGLAGKVDPSAARLSTAGLSAGERRRLALVAALLEAGEIYVLDEWAADQDPHHRAAFYHEYVPALRERGATVVVITHDDRYFGCADRVLRFEEGAAICEARESLAPRAAEGA